MIGLLVWPVSSWSKGKQQNSVNNQQAVPQQRPRLFLDERKVVFLQSAIYRKPYSNLWKPMQGWAKICATKRKLRTSKQKLNTNWVRVTADCLPNLALAYLLTGDWVYLNATKEWMREFVSWPHWVGNEDLGAAHILFNMSVVYDWLHGQLSSVERRQFREKIRHHANIFVKLMTSRRKKFWAKAPLQNHNHTNIGALAIAGVALSGEVKETGQWLALAKKNFENVLTLLSPDGASHEGVSYWGYGVESLLKYFMGTASVYGLEWVKNTPYLQNSARFRLYTALPGYRDNSDFGDSPRQDSHGPGHILRALAGVFKDGHAQWLAERLEHIRGWRAQSVKSPLWMSLLWNDESIPSKPPHVLPTFAYFDNMGIFVNRSDWSDQASWFFFKAGSPQGKLAAEKSMYRGFGHVHPDAGGFQLWNNGLWVVVDDGYVVKKRTKNHNVLLFNGVGQLGEHGERWFNTRALRNLKETARFIHRDMKQEYRYLVADLSKLYPSKAQLKRWLRTVVAFPDGKVIIYDDVELHKIGQIESLVHTPFLPEKMAPNRYCLTGGVQYTVKAFPDDKTNLNLNPYFIPLNEQRQANGEGYVLSMFAKGTSRLELMHFFSPGSDNCKSDDKLEFDGNADVIRFQKANSAVTVDLKRRLVNVSE